MKYRMLQLAGVLALLAVVGKFYAVPALAQVKAAIVQNRDEPGRNMYQSTQNCYQVQQPCVIPFPAVPAGQRLVVKNVSAIVTTQHATSFSSLELRGGSQNIFQFLPATPVSNNYAAQYQYMVNQPVWASYDAGEVPTVDAFSTDSATFTVVVTMSGYLITIP